MQRQFAEQLRAAFQALDGAGDGGSLPLGLGFALTREIRRVFRRRRARRWAHLRRALRDGAPRLAAILRRGRGLTAPVRRGAVSAWNRLAASADRA